MKRGMIVYDANKPENVIVVDAPTPGHFNYLEGAFISCFPEYKNQRFALVVCETREDRMDGAIVSKPYTTSVVNMMGEISGDEFVDLLSGTKAPNMKNKARR